MTLTLNGETVIDDPDPSWEADRLNRCDPKTVTDLFHSSVPILRFLDWRITETARGFVETMLPLNVNSTNQHIAHQAAVMLISADYTGGAALATLLDGVPLVGVHSQRDDYGAYLWGAKADITWIRPSVDDLVCSATIEKSRRKRILRRFLAGSPVLETVRIDMKNRDEIVAIANITYWVLDTVALRRNAFDDSKVHPLFDHRQKASARLIAGLRGLEQERPHDSRLFHDPVAGQLAGNHGMTLARRFCLNAPQLQPMVAARTRHLDDLISTQAAATEFQLVNIGAGLDSRAYRLQMPEKTKSYELDLPFMLKKRTEALDALGIKSSMDRIAVPIDLRVHELSAALFSAGLDPAVPTIVIWEGGSMYFTEKEIAGLLRSVAFLLRDPRSLFWMDYVHPSVADGTSNIPAVIKFTDSIRCLGEPFITGYEEIDTVYKRSGLELVSDASSNYYIQDEDPELYDLYRFSVARSASA